MKKFFGRIAFVAFAIVLAILSMNQVHSIGSHVVLGMALMANIPQAWINRIEPYLLKAAVFLNLTNKHYEGELKESGTLNIVSVGEISTGDYTGADITFDDLSTTGVTFVLDQIKYFGFSVKDTSSYNSMINLIESGSEKAAQRMARDIDDFIAGLYTQITSNVYGTSVAPIIVGFDVTAGEVRPSVALAALQQKLAEANADQSNPKTVIPAWFASYLLMEFGQRFTAEGDSAGKVGVIAGGKLDMPPIAGFKEIWVSNNVHNTIDAGLISPLNPSGNSLFRIMAGTPDSAITFASVLDKVETGRVEKNFATFVKGINLHGGKIPFEAHMALGTFNIGTPRQN